MTCGIYRIYNRVNDKSYVGLSKMIENRIKKHFYDFEHNIHHNRDIQQVYNHAQRYGVEIFNHEILEQCSVDELQEKEKKWIQYYDSYKNGYNRTQGGELGGQGGLSFPYFKFLYDDRFFTDYQGLPFFCEKDRFGMVRLLNEDKKIDNINVIHRVSNLYFNTKKQYICLEIHSKHERPFTSFNDFQLNFHNMRFLENEISLPLDDYNIVACKRTFDIYTLRDDFEYYKLIWRKDHFSFSYHGDSVFDAEYQLSVGDKRNTFLGMII